MKKVFVFLIIVISTASAYAQDPDYSQTYANPLYLNPAFTGTGTNQRLVLNYRNQWPNIPSNFVDYNVSWDRNIIDSSTGIGLLANQDNAGQGTLITTTASLSLSRQFHVKSFTLSIGVQFTYYEKYLDWSKLTFGDMIDPTQGFIYGSGDGPGRTSVGVPDISAGLLGYGKYYFVGFAMSHLTQPDVSFVTGASPLPMKFVINGGYNIAIGSVTLTPTLLWEKQQDFSLTIFECYANWKWFTIGFGTRLGDELISTIGFQSKYFRVGFSYDYTTSLLTNETGGAYEGSLAMVLPYKLDKLHKQNGVNCPFF